MPASNHFEKYETDCSLFTYEVQDFIETCLPAGNAFSTLCSGLLKSTLLQVFAALVCQRHKISSSHHCNVFCNWVLSTQDAYKKVKLSLYMP